MHLGCLAGAYCAPPNEFSRLTPYLLTMGREVRLPAELVFGSTDTYDGELITTYRDYVNILRTKCNMPMELLAQLYDVEVDFHRYQEGEVVKCLT